MKTEDLKIKLVECINMFGDARASGNIGLITYSSSKLNEIVEQIFVKLEDIPSTQQDH